MLQLEINLCFFAFYELVPDWEEDNTHNGPGEEQKQSQSGKCQYPDWGITWFITQLWLWLVPSSYWSLAGRTGPPLVTLGQSGDLRSANNEQSIMHARSALTTHPSLPFPSIFRAFCSDCEHWTMFVLVATTALLFSSFRSYFSFNLSRLFLPHQAILIIILKK